MKNADVLAKIVLLDGCCENCEYRLKQVAKENEVGYNNVSLTDPSTGTITGVRVKLVCGITGDNITKLSPRHVCEYWSKK